MPTLSPIPTIGDSPRNIKTMWVAGGVAGVLTCTGIKVGDRIISVARFTTASFAPGTDLTAEFKNPAVVVNQIDNTGGTSTAAQLLLVTYGTRDVGGP